MKNTETQNYLFNFDQSAELWDWVTALSEKFRSKGQFSLTIDAFDLSVDMNVSPSEVELNDYLRNVHSQASVDKKTTHVGEYTEVNMYGDGGSRGNPGPAASGFVLFDLDNNRVAEGGTYLGHATNNQAEYQSIVDGCDKALKMGVKRINIFMDSQLAVRQILGEYKVKNEGLKVLYDQVVQLLDKFDDYTVSHVPRELNKDADAMANKIMDANA